MNLSSIVVLVYVILFTFKTAYGINISLDNDLEKIDEKIIVLMADRATRSETLHDKILNTPLKRSWVENWTSPEQFFEWTFNEPSKGKYRVSVLIKSNYGNIFEIVGKENTLTFTIDTENWDYIELAESLILPKGKSTIRIQMKKKGWAHFRALHLINLADEVFINQQIQNFRSNTQWLRDAQFGLMFQWGGWGYPQHGDKKPWPQMVEDFDVEKFANLVQETGAGYVVWSATWAKHLFPAPIEAIKKVTPEQVSRRDLITNLSQALHKRDIRLILYYHLGVGARGAWFSESWNYMEDMGDFYDHFCEATAEVGERYGKKLDGWMIDDGMIIAPANFGRLGKALKAGNPDRIIAYNSWILPRMTDLQDFHFGEGNEWGQYAIGEPGTGIIKAGAQKGLQAHANFILDGPGWGIRRPETVINPPRFNDEELMRIAENARQKKMTLSFNLLMYEDGSVSQKSLDALKTVRRIIEGDIKLSDMVREVPRRIDIISDNITYVMGGNGELSGHLKLSAPREPRKFVNGFVTPQDAITWAVHAPEAGYFKVAVQYCPGRLDISGSVCEVSNGRQRITTPVKTLKEEYWMWGQPDRPSFRRDWFDEEIYLEKGVNTLSFRLSEVTPQQAELASQSKQNYNDEWPRHRWPRKSFHFYTLELIRSDEYPDLLESVRSLKSDTNWMVEGKYGIFIHWTSRCYPLYGNKRKSYQQAVKEFNVNAFADMVEETGAAWVIFTAYHGRFYLPAPCKSLDNVLSGRTCERDLIMELADALEKKNVKLILYFGVGYEFDREYARSSGLSPVDRDKNNRIMMDIFSELGQRYGRRVSGWVIDDSDDFARRNMPFKELTKALKIGNPDRLVSYHTWVVPAHTPYGDFLTMDLGHSTFPLPPMPRSWFEEGGFYAGLQPQFNSTMEGQWVPREPYNGKFPAPMFTPSEYVQYFKYMADHEWPLTINLIITQDVIRNQSFVNPESLQIMRMIRKAVREK